MNKKFIHLLFVPVFLLFIIFPALILLMNLDYEGIAATFHDPFFWSSVKNTLLTAIAAAAISLLVAIGFGYYHLFHRNSAIYKIAYFFNELPLALPHTVAGLALLLAFGRNHFSFISNTGLAFSIIAIIIAMFFTSYPLCARAITSGIEQTDREMIEVARTLGDNEAEAYFRIVLPNCTEALFAGFVVAFSRSLSEFAAAVIFGGNIAGKTQVLAAYVFTNIESGNLDRAITAGAFCMLLALLPIGILTILKKGKVHART